MTQDFFSWLISDRSTAAPGDAVTEKHLMGKHDQKTHGRKRAGGDGPPTPSSHVAEDPLSARKRAATGVADVGEGYPKSVQEWASTPIGDRLGKWKSLGKEPNGAALQDHVANARHSVKAEIKNRLKGMGVGNRPKYSEDIRSSIAKRLDQAKHMMQPDGQKKIQDTLNELDGALEASGVDSKLRHKLAMDATDALIVQEHESIGRQLGDHGINHIRGNIEVANAILDAHPAPDTPEQKAGIYLANIYHDTGYLTPPSQMFMDRGHERWGAQHYNAHVRPLVARALGHNQAGEVENLIRTHADPGIDWKREPVATAMRVGDNMALFHREKLAGLFRYIPENIGTLTRLRDGAIDVDGAKKEILNNIKARSSEFSKPVRQALERAASEVSAMTPKFQLGMLGGAIKSISWKNGALLVQLKKDVTMSELHKLMDLGQRQFAKWAETYGVDPKTLTQTLDFTLKDTNGQTVLVTQVVEEKEFQSLGEIAIAGAWVNWRDQLGKRAKELAKK